MKIGRRTPLAISDYKSYRHKKVVVTLEVVVATKGIATIVTNKEVTNKVI